MDSVVIKAVIDDGTHLQRRLVVQQTRSRLALLCVCHCSPSIKAEVEAFSLLRSLIDIAQRLSGCLVCNVSINVFVSAYLEMGPAYTDVVDIYARRVWNQLLLNCTSSGCFQVIHQRILQSTLSPPVDRELLCILISAVAATLCVQQSLSNTLSSSPHYSSPRSILPDALNNMLQMYSPSKIVSSLQLLSCNDRHLFDFCFIHVYLHREIIRGNSLATTYHLIDSNLLVSPHLVFAYLVHAIIPTTSDIVDHLCSDDTSYDDNDVPSTGNCTACIVSRGGSFLDYFVTYLRLLTSEMDMAQYIVNSQIQLLLTHQEISLYNHLSFWDSTVMVLLQRTQTTLETMDRSTIQTITYNIKPLIRRLALIQQLHFHQTQSLSSSSFDTGIKKTS